MPPKKRNRDGEPEGPDPDQLDKDELKAMLRDSIDREAQLTSQLEEQKKQAEAEKEGREKRDEESKLERLFLYYCDRSPNFHDHAAVVYYPNFNVVQQAEASGMERLLDIKHCLSIPGLTCWDHRVLHLAVETCTELVDIFENGVKAGSKLCEDSQEDSLFSIVLVSDIEADDPTVLPGTEDQYLVIAARSSAQRYNALLARYLNRSTDLGPNLDEYRFLRNDKDYIYEDPIHDRLLRALSETEFNTVLKNVWVPEAPSEDRKNRKFEVELDLDRMVEVTVGNMEEATIGFWYHVRDDESDEDD